MGDESIAGIIIMAVCCFGSALLFFGIGIWAKRSEKPVHFWSGTTIDPKTVRDIPSYNRANALIWKVYSVPYWIAGIFSCLEPMNHVFMILAAVLLGIACIPGAFFLVFAYRRIEKTYILG